MEFIIFLAIFGAAVLGIIGFFIATNNSGKLKRLSILLDQLNLHVRTNERILDDFIAQEKQRRADAEDMSPEKPVPDEIAAPEQVEAAQADAILMEPEEVTDVAEPPKQEIAEETIAVAPAKDFENLEDNLSSRWMIWVGGLALALGGGFLVKYSIDEGLLSPAVRIVLGLIFGVALIGFGEHIRRKRGGISWLDGAPDYIPSAISAAGLFTLFAVVYSAYALYDFIPAILAFVLMAGISLGASIMALAQGRFFIYLGLLGGMLVPVLVSTGNNNAWALFPYLLFIATSSLWVVKQRGWIDAAMATIALALFWVLIWFATNWHDGDIAPVGLYLIALGGVSGFWLTGASLSRAEGTTANSIRPVHPVSMLYDAATLFIFVLLAALVRIDHYSAFALMLFGVAMVGQAFILYRSAEQDSGGLAALAASVFLLATWHMPHLVDFNTIYGANAATPLLLLPIAPPGFTTFITMALMLAMGVGAAIYAALPSLQRKPMWASLGAAYPVIILVVIYGRLNNFDVSFPFAAMAVGLAALLTMAVMQLNKMRADWTQAPIAAYAAGATAALALALTMVLRDAWLSFALTLEVVALGHIWRLYPLKGLRRLALVLAAIVLVRLFLNGSIFDYAGGQPLGIVNWLFYGYGLSAGLFIYAAKLFSQEDAIDQDDGLLSTLKAGAVMMVIAFTTFEIRVLLGETGNLLGKVTQLEAALQTINWGVATTILFWMEIKHGDIVIQMLRKVMTVISLGGLLLAGTITNNVFFRNIDVGSMVVFNLQLLQFFVPGLLYASKAYLALRADKLRSQKIYGGVALVTFFVWISVEVRHFFHPYNVSTPSSDWETYSYSLAWLLYAVLLLFGGIVRGQTKLRMAGLALLGVVVLKVFIFDMNNLDGIARALSFMGLGAALIGIGYLYQRLKVVAVSEDAA